MMIARHLRETFMVAALGVVAMTIPAQAAPKKNHVCQHGVAAGHGVASWYGPGFNGRRTANGERFNMHAYTAAHKTLPLGTVLMVTNRENGESLVVRVNDRGPYVPGRVLDLSYAAAEKLGFDEQGTTAVSLRICP